MRPSPLGHHTETADPALLEWIKHVLDSVLGSSATVWVIAIAAVILAIPAAILGLHLYQRRAERLRRG